MARQGPSVGLALIVRDEETSLPRLLGSVVGAFDQVVLLDTGSRDRTVAVFEDWAEAEYERNPDFTWEVAGMEWAHDFGAARNIAHSLLSTDWQVWADADDTITGAENLRGIAAQAPPEVNGYIFGYQYATDDYGNCICYLKRERLMRAGVTHWEGAVHEAQAAPNMQEVEPSIAEWVHHKAGEPGPGGHQRNLRILRKWLKREPENPRVLAYLGTEEAARGRFKQAAPYFKRYLKLETGWPEERVQVHRKLAICLLALDRPQEAYEHGLKPLEIIAGWPDSFLTLAQADYQLQRPRNAIHWAQRVLDIGMPDSLLILNPLDYTVMPKTVLAAAHGALGDVETAIRYGREVLEAIPSHSDIRAGLATWEQASVRESVARTFCGQAELLIRHDEQLKALELLERCVPVFAQDHPQVVQLRSAVRERLAFMRASGAYGALYEANEEAPDEYVPDERVEAVAGSLPRAHFLREGLEDQAA